MTVRERIDSSPSSSSSVLLSTHSNEGCPALTWYHTLYSVFFSRLQYFPCWLCKRDYDYEEMIITKNCNELMIRSRNIVEISSYPLLSLQSSLVFSLSGKRKIYLIHASPLSSSFSLWGFRFNSSLLCLSNFLWEYFKMRASTKKKSNRVNNHYSIK